MFIYLVSMKKNFIILSVGGSIVIPKTGFDYEFLKNFRKLIISEVKKGKKFILVIGGGATCRTYQTALSQLIKTTPELLDWMGIHTTHFNAEFVRLMFGDLAHPEVVKNPTVPFKTKKPIVIAGGWKPGCSTDTDAVLLAENFGATEVVNLSNIDYVYSADPVLDPSAMKFERLSWKEYKMIVGSTWTPGMSAPFDPIATKKAERLGLKVLFAKGSDLEQVKKIFAGKKFKGTIIA